MIVIFVAFLALVSGGSLLMKDREFSRKQISGGTAQTDG